MLPDLHLDIETRSAIDLKKAGTYLYAAAPSTDVWCAAYAFGDEPVELWTPGEPCPPRIVAHVEAGGTIVAYNAIFERLLWWAVLTPRYGWPKPPIEQFKCVMVRALAMSLPGSLENAAGAVGLTITKDQRGYRRMIQMCTPKKEHFNGALEWWDDEPRRLELYAYCKQDVEVERALDKRLLHLTAKEQKLWWLDQKICDRGISVDIASCRHALKAVDAAKKQLDKRIRKVSGDKIASTTAAEQIKTFLATLGVNTDSIAKDDLTKLLDRDDLPPVAREVLQLRQEGSKSSTTKLTAAVNMADKHGRVRGLVQYHGASTGRWAGRGLQPHNLPREMPDWPIVEEFFQRIPTEEGREILDMMHGSIPTLVSKCLRAFVVAKEGHELLVSDFSAIEACVLAWLAGQDDLVEVFKRGEDVYNKAASAIYGRKIDRKRVKADEEPGQIGKVSILALGYAGGIGAFASMAKNYQIDVAICYPTMWGGATPQEREKAEAAYKMYKARVPAPCSHMAGVAADIIKQRWRAGNGAITQYWYDLEEAALDAVRHPGQTFTAGAIPVRYKMSGSFLWCQLPSGRCLCYPYPKIVQAKMPWKTTDGKPVFKDQISYKGVDSLTKKWGDHSLYGGLLAENVTQAVARDLLAEAMTRADANGYVIVCHIHDEIIAEMPVGQSDIKAFDKVMCELPAWAEGCPVTAKGFATKRYRK